MISDTKRTDGGVGVTVTVVGMEARVVVGGEVVVEDSSGEPGGIGVYAITSSC
jgi:hypothetical protein